MISGRHGLSALASIHEKACLSLRGEVASTWRLSADDTRPVHGLKVVQASPVGVKDGVVSRVTAELSAMSAAHPRPALQGWAAIGED